MNLKNVMIIAIIVGMILLIPLFGSLFAEVWIWGFEDFVIAFVILFCSGLAIDFVIQILPIIYT